jgi:LSD1 subclass zinc finger protein
MVLFSQLVCRTCCKILTYPLGAVSCRCRNCSTVNPSQHMVISCGHCETTLLVPINTLVVLCPCCASKTDIPVEWLPLLPSNVNIDGKGDGKNDARTIYVENPPLRCGGGTGQQSILVATKIL